MNEKSVLTIAIEFLTANFYGLAGALLSLFFTQKVGIGKGLVSFTVGFILAVVVPNAISDFRLLGDSTKQGVAFLVGITGMNLTLALMRLIAQAQKDPLSIVSDFFKIIRGNYKNKDEEDK